MPKPLKEVVDSQTLRAAVSAAIAALEKDGISIREAGRRYNIPESTIRFHCKRRLLGKPPAPHGHFPSIPLDVSADLASLIKTAATCGFPFSVEDIRHFVGQFVAHHWDGKDDLGLYLRTHCRFTKYMPGKDWMRSFLENNSLSLKKPSTLEKVRKLAESNPWTIYEFFDLLEGVVERLGLQGTPENVYNCDESAFFIDPLGGKVVSAIGDATKRVTAGAGRTCISAMACVSAAGTFLPPLVIFDGKNLQTSWKGSMAMPGTMYAVSENGWMTCAIFCDWLKQFAELAKQRPTLLLLDGHRSHVSLEAIYVARENGITLLKLPSHTTHLLQPLDKSCFRPLKVAWEKKVLAFQREHGFRAVRKSDFVDLLCSAWAEGLTPANITAGFANCGIFPVCRERYPIEKFNPAMLTSYQVQKGLKTMAGPSQPTTMDSASPVQLIQNAPTLRHPSIPGVPDFPMPSDASSIPSVPFSSPSSSTSIPHLHQFYMNTIQAGKKVFSEEAIKRRAIHACAKVLTDKDMDAEVTVAKKNKKSQLTKHDLPAPSSSVPYSCSPSKEASHNARVDDYVLLKLLPKGRKAAHPIYYVGNVMGVIDSQYRVQCLRRHNMSLCAFFFPDKEDIALYPLSDIVVILPQPKIVRSIYHFPGEVFEAYANGLR